MFTIFVDLGAKIITHGKWGSRIVLSMRELIVFMYWEKFSVSYTSHKDAVMRKLFKDCTKYTLFLILKYKCTALYKLLTPSLSDVQIIDLQFNSCSAYIALPQNQYRF